jgi:hypothetical protein
MENITDAMPLQAGLGRRQELAGGRLSASRGSARRFTYMLTWIGLLQ